MKKIYIAPKMQVVNVELQQMIAESVSFNANKVNAEDAEARGLVWELEEVTDEE